MNIFENKRHKRQAEVTGQSLVNYAKVIKSSCLKDALLSTFSFVVGFLWVSGLSKEQMQEELNKFNDSEMNKQFSERKQL